MKSNQLKTPQPDATTAKQATRPNQPKPAANVAGAEAVGGDEHGRDLVAEAQDGRENVAKRDAKPSKRQPETSGARHKSSQRGSLPR